MDRESFKASRALLLGRRAIQLGNLSNPEVEVRLQGRYGWVRQMPDGQIYVAYTQTGGKRLSKIKGIGKVPRVGRGEEYFIYLSESFIDQVEGALRLIRNRPAQVKAANTHR